MQPYMINTYEGQKYQPCNTAGPSMIMQFQHTNQLLATINLGKSTDSMSASSSSPWKTIHRPCSFGGICESVSSEFQPTTVNFGWFFNQPNGAIKSTFKYHNNYKIKIYMKQLKIRITCQQNRCTLLGQHHRLLDLQSWADRLSLFQLASSS